MSLPSSGRTRTPARARVTQPIPTRRNTGGLDDSPAGANDSGALLEHLGNNVIRASVNRQFSKAYRRNEDGVSRPVCYRVNSDAFARCQYAMLTTKENATVLVADSDQPGTPDPPRRPGLRGPTEPRHADSMRAWPRMGRHQPPVDQRPGHLAD